MRRRTHRDDGGSVVAEFAALLPVQMMFVVAVLVVGKLNNASSNVEAAARSAARTMSFGVDRNVGAAEGAAREQAAAIAEAGGTFCTNEGTFFDADYQPNNPPLVPSEVTVTITCVVDLSEVAGMGIPGTHTVTADSTEVVDPYREAAP